MLLLQFKCPKKGGRGEGPTSGTIDKKNRKSDLRAARFGKVKINVVVSLES